MLYPIMMAYISGIMTTALIIALVAIWYGKQILATKLKQIEILNNEQARIKVKLETEEKVRLLNNEAIYTFNAGFNWLFNNNFITADENLTLLLQNDDFSGLVKKEQKLFEEMETLISAFNLDTNIERLRLVNYRNQLLMRGVFINPSNPNPKPS